MSNTPQQQAELYRKAAETIEMCAKHGIKPMVRIEGHTYSIQECNLKYFLNSFEFPLAVISGQLVWVDTVVYNCKGITVKACLMNEQCGPYTLTPPKPKTVMVEIEIDDADMFQSIHIGSGAAYGRIAEAFLFALDNLKYKS